MSRHYFVFHVKGFLKAFHVKDNALKDNALKVSRDSVVSKV